MNNQIQCVFCFVAALLLSFQYLLTKNAVDEAATWPRISGTIESMFVEYTSSRRGGFYTPHIGYNFKFNGRDYHANKISFPDPTFDNFQAGEAFKSTHPVGGIVSVYCDPKLPSNACLVPLEGESTNHMLWLAIGLLVLSAVLPFMPNYSGRAYGGAMSHNPNSMITPSR